jgi:hypothetical protein
MPETDARHPAHRTRRADGLTVNDVPIPEVRPGRVRIRVMAFVFPTGRSLEIEVRLRTASPAPPTSEESPGR